jgi:hypothetical protein
MVICGIDRNGAIREPKAPHGKTYSRDIQAMRNRSCFLNPDKGITIDPSWTFAQLDVKVRNWFPRVFDALDRKPGKRTSTSTLSSRLPDWRLLTRTGSTFNIVEVVEPNGSTLYENKGRNKACIAESQLWFVTRNRIAQATYDSWNTQPTIAGSDTDNSLYDSDVVIFSDDDADEFDNKLTSSMIRLDLDEDIEVGNKGKGKAGKTKTPDRSHAKRSRVMLSPESPSQSEPTAPKKIKDLSANPIPIYWKPVASSQSPASHGGSNMDPFAQHLLSPPRVSPAPTAVSVSRDDILLRDRVPSDDPDCPPMLNPWDSRYSLLNSDDFSSFF